MKNPPKPKHGRTLGLLGIALTKARNPRNSMPAMLQVREEIERVLIDTGYCENAEFSNVVIAVRFGLKEELFPNYQAINKKYGELPLGIEVSVEEMQGASLNKMKRIFKSAVLRSLIHAGEKYKRPIAELERLKREMQAQHYSDE